MKFGPVPTDAAEGAILAHSLSLPGARLKKGTVLGASDIAALRAGGLDEVIAARLGEGDLGEDAAAERIGAGLTGDGLTLGPVFTGRINLIATRPGLVRIDVGRIERFNAIDEGLTLATLPDLTRVTEGQLVATVKIIPYALPRDVVDRGGDTLGEGAIRSLAFGGGRARLVMTATLGFKESLLKKGEAAVRARVEALGYSLAEVRTVPHEEGAVAEALAGEADLTLILGASATSDRDDVAPAAVVRAGGRIARFGMPVDPGNLLFLGDLRGAPVVGLPGCARSPALNGVDWVLERLAAGVEVTGASIAAMGVGGLLKEMRNRPQPRHPDGDE